LSSCVACYRVTRDDEDNVCAGNPPFLENAEKALQKDGCIVVTCHAKPIAKLVSFTPPVKKTQRAFSMEEHLKWLEEFWKDDPREPWTDEWIRESRRDRDL